MIEIRLDGDPVGKGRPRFVRATGRTYTPEKTASFEARLGYAAQAVMRGTPLLDEALDMLIMLYMGVPASWSQKKRQQALTGIIYPTTKPDIDNAIKLVMDALNRVVYVDDKCVVDIRAYKRYSDCPRTEIFVKKICLGFFDT
jgi:Holliday junction resolvase RusA-like endonuclease